MINIKSKKLLFKLFLILCFFSGCKKNKIDFVNNKVKQNSGVLKSFNDGAYKLFIGGIECKLCKKTAIEIIKKIDEINFIDFFCSDFDSCYAIVTTKNKNQNLNFQNIIQKLKSESFLLKSVEGQFCGIYRLKDNKLIFEIEGLNIEAKVKNKVENHVSLNKFVIEKAKLNLTDDVYSFYKI